MDSSISDMNCSYMAIYVPYLLSHWSKNGIKMDDHYCSHTSNPKSGRKRFNPAILKSSNYAGHEVCRVHISSNTVGWM